MKLISMVQGILVGAAVMYLFDPERGQKRRTEIADKARNEFNKKREAFEVMKQDFSNRAKGLKQEVMGEGHPERPAMESMFPEKWTPSLGLMMSVLGAGMVLRGMTKRQPMGGFIALAGFALLAKAFSDTENRFEMVSEHKPELPSTEVPQAEGKKQKTSSRASVR